MASDDSSGSRPAAPIVLRIKLRYDDVEVMVQRFATNVGKSGLFLPTKSLQPIGAEIKFELRLADDTPALVGLGRVKAATAPDPNNPKATFGMAIELMRVTPQSRALILRMLERRRAMGLPEVGLPMTADIDAARRAEAVAGHARDPVSGPVPVVAAAASLVAPPVPGAVSAAMPAPMSAPVGAAIDALPGEALLTAPRRTTGPMAVAKVLAVTPLAPEPPRRKRMAMSEIIESASGPIASVSVALPGLDDEVDLAAAMVRARALAGGALDAELDALAEVAAAPLEISIEAASAELARQLGGSAVRRDRSARWAPPPVTTSPGPPAASPQVAAQLHPPDAEEPELPQTAVADPAEPAESHAAEPAESHAAEPAELYAAGPAEADAPEPAAHDDDAGAFALPYADHIAVQPSRRASRSGHHEVDPGQIADDLHQLSELDMEDVEHTEMGDIPVDPGEPAGDDHEPSVDHELLAARLEAQLAEAEAEADADVLGLAAALGAALDDDPAAGYVHRAAYDVEPAGDDPGEPALDLSLEEIDDFEILAEADADDEDLLAAHGEQDASDSRERLAAPRIVVRQPSELDFAARLDLGDESDRHFVASENEFSAHHVLDGAHDDLADRLADSLLDELADQPRRRDPLLDSAGHALAAFDTGDEPFDEPAASDSQRALERLFGPESTGSFTIAGIPADSLDLEPPPPARREPAGAPRPARSQRASVHGEPAILRGAPSPLALPSLHGAPVEDYELEHALEALDVDLDDLSIPHAATQLQRARDPAKSRPIPAAGQAPQAQGRVSRPTPTPTPAPSRAARQTDAAPVAPSSGRGAAPRITTEDGVVIDFDDDDD